jgi:hypothetical protein
MVRSYGQGSESTPIRTLSPTCRRLSCRSADRRSLTPSTAVPCHLSSTRQQAETVGNGSERDRDASGPDDVGEFDRINGVKGNSTLIKGAGSDRIRHEEIGKSINPTENAASRCDGYFYADATCNKKLLLKHVRTGLHS